jgi:hypothetical protein
MSVQNKELLERVDSMSRLFLTLVQKSWVYPPLFRSNYIHNESTHFDKSAESRTISMEMSQLSESTRKKVDSVATTGIFHLTIYPKPVLYIGVE